VKLNRDQGLARIAAAKSRRGLESVCHFTPPPGRGPTQRLLDGIPNLGDR